MHIKTHPRQTPGYLWHTGDAKHKQASQPPDHAHPPSGRHAASTKWDGKVGGFAGGNLMSPVATHNPKRRATAPEHPLLYPSPDRPFQLSFSVIMAALKSTSFPWPRENWGHFNEHAGLRPFQKSKSSGQPFLNSPDGSHQVDNIYTGPLSL